MVQSKQRNIRLSRMLSDKQRLILLSFVNENPSRLARGTPEGSAAAVMYGIHPGIGTAQASNRINRESDERPER